MCWSYVFSCPKYVELFIKITDPVIKIYLQSMFCFKDIVKPHFVKWCWKCNSNSFGQWSDGLFNEKKKKIEFEIYEGIPKMPKY